MSEPHIQVARNQQFMVEWAIGHGSETKLVPYFVMVAEEDEAFLSKTTVDVLEDYINSAPTPFTFDPAWQKVGDKRFFYWR